MDIGTSGNGDLQFMGKNSEETVRVSKEWIERFVGVRG